MRKSDQQHHSTFFVQSLFFLLVFVENMLLASWPLIKGRASERMSGEKLALFTSNLANTSHIFCSSFLTSLKPKEVDGSNRFSWAKSHNLFIMEN